MNKLTSLNLTSEPILVSAHGIHGIKFGWKILNINQRSLKSAMVQEIKLYSTTQDELSGFLINKYEPKFSSIRTWTWVVWVRPWPTKKGGRPSAGGSHMSGVWGREKPRQAFPRKIYRDAASNPRPGDSVRQLSPLHQACPSRPWPTGGKIRNYKIITPHEHHS